MTKLFQSVRLLAFGKARALTNGDIEGHYIDEDMINPSRVPV